MYKNMNILSYIQTLLTIQPKLSVKNR